MSRTEDAAPETPALDLLVKKLRSARLMGDTWSTTIHPKARDELLAEIATLRARAGAPLPAPGRHRRSVFDLAWRQIRDAVRDDLFATPWPGVALAGLLALLALHEVLS